MSSLCYTLLTRRTLWTKQTCFHIVMRNTPSSIQTRTFWTKPFCLTASLSHLTCLLFSSYQNRTIWTKTSLSVCFSVPSHLFTLLFLPEEDRFDQNLFVYLLLCPISPVYSSLHTRTGPFGPKPFCRSASQSHLTCLPF